MSADVITVGKMTVSCAVLRNHPAPVAVKRRLDDVLAGPLHAALATIMEPLARLRSDEVVIIERLELSFTLDPSRAIDEVARAWAAQLAARLLAALRDDSRVPQLRFADDAHYLARFLVDQAAGRAAAKWYYRRFRGLAALPTPAILRSAILDEPAGGLSALATLAPRELAGVLAALGEREAERIVQAMVGLDGERDDFAAAAAALVDAAALFRALDPAPLAPFTTALALTASAAAGAPRASLPSLARLAAALAASSSASAGAVEAAGRSRVAPDLAPLVALTPARRAELQAMLRPSTTVRADVTAAAHTRFGGLILLLARSADGPLERLFADERDRATLRLTLLSRCAGSWRRRAVLGDALLQRLCGLDAGESVAAIEAWGHAHAATLARDVPPALAATRVPLSRALGLTLARAPAVGTLALTVAEPDGYWLALEPLDPSLRALLRRAAPADGGALPYARDLSPRRARRSSRVLRHLLADENAPPRDAELALVVAAQQLLHAFARTLIGFSESSPTFLYDNFLAFSATVEEVGGRSICRMGRPPLATLLSLTGAQRGRLALPWLRGGGLELYAGG